MNESVYKLRPGSTASDLDELDADLSRMKISGKPNFSKLTYTIDKTKIYHLHGFKIYIPEPPFAQVTPNIENQPNSIVGESS